jgi:ERCC4-related helicase
MTLVATNVAARGLDINDVQLIIQVYSFIYNMIYYNKPFLIFPFI